MDSNNNIIEDLDMDYYFSGIESDLRAANLDLNSRVFPDKLVEGLDKLVESNKYSSSSKFNRILFSHILDFKDLGKTNNPILVSDFFHSFFQVYESMRRNRDYYGKNCLDLSTKISQYKNEVVKEKQTETVLSNGQTNNSKMRIEIRDISIYQEMSEQDLESIFKGKYILFEYQEEKAKNQQTDRGDSFLLKQIPLSQEGLNNSYQFAITDVNKKISISIVDNEGKQILNDVSPGECFDQLIEKSVEIPEVGRVDFDIVYINSNVNFINKLIASHENDYEESHVHFDNLENSIGLLEDPFKNFMDRHNADPERQLNDDVNPNKAIEKKKESYTAGVHRKEIEVSEKVENMILNVSGRKCIVWDTIYFLLNKIMLGIVILVMAYRADYATVRLFYF